MRTLRVVLALAAGTGFLAGPSSADPAGPPVSMAGVSLSDPVAGEPDTIWIDLRIEDGYHVQANPATDAFLVPLTFAMDPVDRLEIGPVLYPPPVRFRLPGTEEDLLTYEGTIRLGVPVLPPTGASPGGRSLRGTVAYQACTDRRCLPPASLRLEFSLASSGPGRGTVIYAVARRD